MSRGARPALVVILIAVAVVFGSCRKKPAQQTAIELANKVSTRTIRLYFEAPQSILVPETRTVALPENEASALAAVVKEVLKGSSNASITPLFPPGVDVRGAFLLADGTAIVDLGGSLANGWAIGSHGEMMAVYGLVQTLCDPSNFKTIRRVRLLVNGQPVPTLAGHIQIDKSLRPMPELLKVAAVKPRPVPPAPVPAAPASTNAPAVKPPAPGSQKSSSPAP